MATPDLGMICLVVRILLERLLSVVPCAWTHQVDLFYRIHLIDSSLVQTALRTRMSQIVDIAI